MENDSRYGLAFSFDASLTVQKHIPSGTDGQLRCRYNSGGLGRVFNRQPSDSIWMGPAGAYKWVGRKGGT